LVAAVDQPTPFNDREANHRPFRVGELLRHALGEVFLRGDLRDPGLEGAHITISEVRLTPDLRVATVYVSVFGEFDPKALLEGLRRATPYLKARVGKTVRLRHVPRLFFKVDPSVAESDHIADILHRPKVRKDLAVQPAYEDESFN
tara:strand:- start:263 stop:700 length:438 start_codon:yes stop_codon:yes gene_type:complete